MVIASIEEVSAGCVKIITSTGPSFFIRTSYLTLVKPEELEPEMEFLEEKENDIISAGFSFAAEKKAVDYLARAEQSRRGLLRKLLDKGFESPYINTALDYLEEVGYLSDFRFSRAWLNNRKIGHSEGRTRLASELSARGIARQTIQDALDDFFENNNEIDLCRKALKKCQRLKKSPEKTFSYLMQSGFPYRMIQDVLSEEISE